MSAGKPKSDVERAKLRQAFKRARERKIREEKTGEKPLHFSDQDTERLFAKQDGKCLYCKRPLAQLFHRDHFIPVSKGGSDSPDNIALSCPECNRSKGSLWPWEWDGWLGFFPMEFDFDCFAPTPRI